MITTGRQIAAARAMLDLDQTALAKAAKVHRNAVAYWERRTMPPGETPYAVRKIARALSDRGIEVFSTPSPGVRIVQAEQLP